MQYKFTITANGVTRVVHPIYKNDISKEIAKESGQQFFRETLSGSLKFVGADFEWINSQPFETEFKLAINEEFEGVEPGDVVPIGAEHIVKSVPYGSGHGLPQLVEVYYSDGSMSLQGVVWESVGQSQFNSTVPGTYELKGVFDQMVGEDNPNNVSASALVTVLAQ